MKRPVYQAEYAGHTVRYRFLHPGTRMLFRSWVRCVEGDAYDVSVTPERMEETRAELPDEYSDSDVEFRALIGLTSHALLPLGCCLIHAVAFLWRGRAWLLAAPSGTGKTTQFLNWQRLHPDEITVICGDMPVLERREDGSIWVHPSPWNGKERLGDRRSPAAPLGGLVSLAQGRENEILPMPVGDAISVLFNQFLLLPDTEEEILMLTSLMDALLRAGPVWQLTNRGDDASTELLRQTWKGGGHDPL